MLPKKHPRPATSKNGFALIVTLTLMILLTILALGLLGLSSVALRTSSQGDSQAEARANARMALMMAIAELQKELGPDSRISAPYDAGKDATGGSVPPTNGQPNWTAVYDAWKWNTNVATAETPLTRAPKFRGWLVSGANQALGGPAGTGEFATLVGAASLSASAKTEDQINVPMLKVSRGNRSGRIAWWTSDESMKAKITAGGDTSLASKPLSDSQSPPHVGHKAIDELAGLNWKPGQRSFSASTAEVNLAAGLGAAGIGNMNHDVTVHSAGVLADVRTGRLKLDLTNLLSRPIAQLENKPLYLTDGRINRFVVAADGSLTNNSWANTNGTGAIGIPLSPNVWGINLEELHLFHEIPREVDWSTGKPQLVNKGSRTAMINDRFFMYRKPTMEALSQIIYFVATAEPKPTPSSPQTYRLDANMDAVVGLSNPNDIPTVWLASVNFLVVTEGFPYRPRWNIRTAPANAVRHNFTVQPINSNVFISSIKSGFTLDSGEVAVFGASSTDTSSQSVNLTRGFALRGVLRIDDKRWDGDNKFNPATDGLRATGLLSSDTVDITMIGGGAGATPSGWITSYARMSDASGGTATGIATHKFGGGGTSNMTTLYTPASIKAEGTSTPTVQNLIGKPLPVLVVTTMANVERSRTNLQPPNALPSRPYLVHEPATANMTSLTTVQPSGVSNLLLTMQNSQLLTIGESFNNLRIMTDSTGKNMLHGGAREAGSFGGSKYVVKRRIPLAAPLSLGAFENAIACGFFQRFAGGPSLNPTADLLPTTPLQVSSKWGWSPIATKVTLAKSIGNSWTNPFLKSDVIQDGTYHDQSWLANTALWDSFFLSGIISPGSSGAWNNDSRTQEQQFRELAEQTNSLRNRRLMYYPHKSTTAALTEIFDSGTKSLKPTAIDKIAKYLLVDGAFNVNSTSPRAWKAFLASVREQELLDVKGDVSKKTYPFGTLGYAVNSATTDTEGDWAGFRDLTDSDIDGLAKAIVDEVKARGPFLNMADFVNRRPNGSSSEQALGALQAAIDKSGINNRFNTAGRTLAPADVAAMPGNATLSNEITPARAIGAAGFLSQGALLTAFGSQITVRGDTFIIRTYGDSRDAADNIQAKAWCEAVVQRTPEYVDQANPPEASTGLSAANTTFGRKFNIVSFRWLSQNEIVKLTP